MRQNLGWAIGYNGITLPIAAVAFAWAGLTRRPEIDGLSMAGFSLPVAANALLLKRTPPAPGGDTHRGLELISGIGRGAWQIPVRRSRVFVLAHLGYTMVLVGQETLPSRLTTAGLIGAQTSGRRDAVRFRAVKPTSPIKSE